jgi:hypothetical protein
VLPVRCQTSERPCDIHEALTETASELDRLGPH